MGRSMAKKEVLLTTYSIAEAKNRQPDFWSSYQRFRAAHDLAALDIDPSEVFAAEKDPSPGRDFAW